MNCDMSVRYQSCEKFILIFINQNLSCVKCLIAFQDENIQDFVSVTILHFAYKSILGFPETGEMIFGFVPSQL